jgi:predicted nucleic acid-binding protein
LSARKSSSRPSSSRPRLRICLDADALFAGAASVSGASHVILQLGELGIIEVGVPDQVRAEAERNLASKLPAALPALRTLVDGCCIGLAMASKAGSAAIAQAGEADPKDAPILASALDAGCGWLVTFNVRDYRTDRIRVSKPGDFIETLRGELLRLGTGP